MKLIPPEVPAPQSEGSDPLMLQGVAVPVLGVFVNEPEVRLVQFSLSPRVDVHVHLNAPT